MRIGSLRWSHFNIFCIPQFDTQHMVVVRKEVVFTVVQYLFARQLVPLEECIT